MILQLKAENILTGVHSPMIDSSLWKYKVNNVTSERTIWLQVHPHIEWGSHLIL